MRNKNVRIFIIEYEMEKVAIYTQMMQSYATVVQRLSHDWYIYVTFHGIYMGSRGNYFIIGVSCAPMGHLRM